VPRHSRPGVRGRTPARAWGRNPRARARHRRRERRKYRERRYQVLRLMREQLRRLRRARQEARRRRRERPEVQVIRPRPGWGLLDGEWVPGRFLAILEEFE